MPDSSSQTIPAQGMPIPFITAAWSGMGYDDIVAGLHDGSILPPPGADPGWLPQPGTVGVAYAPAGDPAEASATATQAAPVVGRDAVARWFNTLDPTLSTAGFDAIWQRAGTTEAQRAQGLTNYLARTLLGASNAQGHAAASGVGEALDAFLADPAHRAHVVDLGGMNGADIAEQAASDVGMRYALSRMDGVALTGNRSLFAQADADGALDRFDRDTGESLVSDAWLEDRGKFLAWKLAHEEGNELSVSGTEDWTFEDRAATDAQGNALTLQLRTGASDAGHNQVIFGTDDTDVMKGMRGSDRMYGGAGDDVLIGAAGGDHLEGGAGADVIMGGAGNDELVGNQGDDELDGGAGADALQAGSGNDRLTGGRGDDRLDGGLGNDTYVLDAGDGHDTIVDADGLGTVELDGDAVGGSMALKDEGGWSSADGRIDFTFDGTADGGTLTLRAFAEGADHSGTPDNVVRIKDWKNGDLGITLGDVGATTDASPTAVRSSEVALAVSPSAPAGPVDGVEYAGEGLIAASNAPAPGSEPASAMAPGGEAPVGVDAATESVHAPVDALSGMSVSALADAPTSGSVESMSDLADGNSNAYDFNSALDSLLDSGTDFAKGLDRAALQRGIDAFSAVLAPPDVEKSLVSPIDSASHGLTAMMLSDALAGDVAGDDLEMEATMASFGTPGASKSLDELLSPPAGHGRAYELKPRA